MNFQDIIDNALIAEQAVKATRIRSGKFSPSSFGRCYRMQYWNRKNEPQSNPVGVEALRRFKVGNIIHQYAQGFFPNAQKEVMINLPDVIGFADIVLDNEVIDIKSCRSFEFKTFANPNYDIKVGKFQNCLQVCAYAHFLGKPFARLIFIEKDALDSKEFVIETKDLAVELKDELEILRGQWANGVLPPASPRAYGGKECSYCNYKDKCFVIENEGVK
jgi:CRISPR/Cas system-associated exonuclease Cas4 (RecB family)